MNINSDFKAYCYERVLIKSRKKETQNKLLGGSIMKLTESILRELEDKKISIENLDDSYLIEYVSKPDDNGRPYLTGSFEDDNILNLLNKDVYSFKEIVDKARSIYHPKYKNIETCLMYLLENEEIFKNLIKTDKLTKDDLRYMLSRIDNTIELFAITRNPLLLLTLLDKFVLTKEIVERFRPMLDADADCKNRNIHTIFDVIEDRSGYRKESKDILKLNELNRKTYMLNDFNLTENERDELRDSIQNDEVARNRMISLVENNLQDQYSFNQLKNLLTKDNDKKLKTKFNF